MNIQQVTRDFTASEGWVGRLLTACLLALTIIGILPVLGWQVEIARRVIDDEKPALPEWTTERLKDYFYDGLRLALAGFLVMGLPGLLAAKLPLWCLEQLSQQGLITIHDWITAESAIVVTAWLVRGTLFMVLITVQCLWVGLLADGASFRILFAYRHLWRLLQAARDNYVVAAFMTFMGLGMTLGPALPGMAIVLAGLGHLYGQVYQEAQGVLAAREL